MSALTAVVAADVLMRPSAPEDADAMLRAYLRNREHLRPWDPHRDESFFTPEAQRARLADQAAALEAGRGVHWVLVREEEVVGTVTISAVVPGHVRSAVLGYWIDAATAGRGLATAAAELACRAADEELGLHRLEAGAAVANTGSQRVLAKCGFERIGVARDYLFLDGKWTDHVLFQRILNDRRP
ncbi:GNAT family N-acetyltransferase [Kitasatospora paranensis]|uniref:GNAT family N-acetyltransferase n=1 Tax=Kitasatospora paranensis TaxID=258053 RepID=A0ABW2FRC4_9ACTN